MADLACPVCGRLNREESAYCAHCGSPLAPAGQWYPTEERKVVTVLFVDLSDFSALGGTLDPETTRTIVARFFAAAREEIRRFGGSVEKFIGDAVMAVFGLPAAHEDDPTRAIEAALAIRRRLETLNETLRAEFGVAVSIHVGINTGEVLAAVGPAEGQDFLITGDAVNVAARLHELARPNQILIGERTYRFGRRVFDFRPAGALSMKGRDQPLAAWEVTGPLPAVAAGVNAPLVGREEELARLRAVADATFAGRRPHLILIAGHPGIGKSRLVEEFRRIMVAAAAGAPAFRAGRCLPRGEAIAYLPLADMLKQECAISDADPPETVREKIDERLRAVGAGDAAEALAYTVGLEAPGSTITRLDPRETGQELVRAWRAFFEARARFGPLVLVFEDLHWAGDPLLELVEAVVGGVTDAPLLVLGAARPDLIERRRRWGEGDNIRTVIRLDPLTDAESERLLDDLLSPGLLPAGLRDTIIARAEGNPFFIEEMVRMLADEGVLVREEGRWRLGQAAGEVTLPDTIHAVIAARIDNLPLTQKAVLQLAAVIGRTFWMGPLRAMAGDADVGDAVEALERKEFIADGRRPTLPGEREYVFKHVLTRDVAYASLPRGARGRMHAQVGEWLERRAGARLIEAVDLLAHHYREAAILTGGPEAKAKAGQYLRQAAEDAYRRYALDQAMTYAQAALALGETEHRPLVEELLGDVLFTAGRLEEAEERYLRALDGYARSLDKARIHRKLVPTVGAGLRIELATQELARAEALLAAEPDRAEHAALLIWKGRLAHHRMAYSQAVDAFTQAGQVLEEIRDRPGLAWSQCFLGSTLLHVGRYDRASVMAREATGIARDIHHPQLMALAYGVLQEVHLLQGEYGAALREEETDLAAATAAGDSELKARVLRILGTILHRLGRLSEAAARLGEAEVLGEPERGKAFALTGLAMVLADLGRAEEATAAVSQARRVTAATHHPELMVRTEISALYLETATGQPGEGLERCEAALRRFPSSHLLAVQALALIGAASADLDDKSRTEEAARACYDMASNDGAAFEALLARHVLGRAEMLHGHWDLAIQQLSQASDGFLRLGANLEWGRALLRLSEAQAAANQPGPAGQTLNAAVNALEACGAVLDQHRAEVIRSRLGIQANR